METRATDHYELTQGNLSIRVQAGQLTGLRKGSHEFMHTADQPGWGNSDTEMFPVIGPTAHLNYTFELPQGKAVLDQHGLLRELDYLLVYKSDTELVLEKKYTASTPVRNSKYPNRSPIQWLSWPYSFTFRKQFLVSPEQLEIVFTIDGDIGMPFMLGYHPAFTLQSSRARVQFLEKEVSIQEILEVGDRAMEVPDCTSIQLEDKGLLSIKTKGFESFMLWTPHSGMLCIEPITFYPYQPSDGGLSDGFMRLTDNIAKFSVCIKPLN